MSNAQTVHEACGIFIVGAACIFPSGPSLPLAHSATRMNMSLFRKHPFWRDQCGQRLTISYFPNEDPTNHKRSNLFDATRWGDLAQAALIQLADSLKTQRYSPSSTKALDCVVWVVLPDPSTPGLPEDLMTAIQHVATSAEVKERWHWQPGGSFVRGGHAAGVLALQQAQDMLRNKPDTLAVVLAIDCPLTSHRLDALEKQGCLHGAQRRQNGVPRANPYGRIPGEGAAAIALMGMAPSKVNQIATESTAKAASNRPPRTWSARYLDQAKQQTAATITTPLYRPLAELLGVGTAQEAVTWAVTQTESKPCLGLGLTQAALAALTQASSSRLSPMRNACESTAITQITTDLNGEPYRGDELGFAVLRLAQQQCQPIVLHDCWKRTTPALASGDLGSASVIAHTALAAYSVQSQTTESENRFGNVQIGCHLVLTSSDDTLRGAVLVGP